MLAKNPLMTLKIKITLHGVKYKVYTFLKILHQTMAVFFLHGLKSRVYPRLLIQRNTICTVYCFTVPALMTGWYTNGVASLSCMAL